MIPLRQGSTLYFYLFSTFCRTLEIFQLGSTFLGLRVQGHEGETPRWLQWQPASGVVVGGGEETVVLTGEQHSLGSGPRGGDKWSLAAPCFTLTLSHPGALWV